jgi:hypothetical protein
MKAMRRPFRLLAAAMCLAGAGAAWRSLRGSEVPVTASKSTGPTVAARGPFSSRAFGHQPNAQLVQASAGDDAPLSATLQTIRREIQDWRDCLGPRPGNRELEAETENRLTGELQDLLNDANTPEIVRSLSPEDLETPFGLAALTRWVDRDPAAAARWIAERPGATDDQAWIVAQRLLEDPVEFERFSGELPDSPWKQEFLGYFGTAVLSLDPVLSVYIAQRMTPGEAQTALLQRATE